MNALRKRAEACLPDLRCVTPEVDSESVDRFVTVAGSTSNCPSGADGGGDLGWLTRDDCAPEFAREIFGKSEVGVSSNSRSFMPDRTKLGRSWKNPI